LIEWGLNTSRDSDLAVRSVPRLGALGVGKVGDLPERAQALGGAGGGDGVVVQAIEVGVAEGAEPGDVLVLDRDALGA
jgi:hypothetical protein